MAGRLTRIWKSARSRRTAAVIVWACVAGYWLYIWRLPIRSVGDLYFATRSGTVHGAIVVDANTAAWRPVVAKWPRAGDGCAGVLP